MRDLLDPVRRSVYPEYKATGSGPDYWRATANEMRERREPVQPSDPWHDVAQEYIRHASAVLLDSGTPISVDNLLRAFPSAGSPVVLHAMNFARADERMADAFLFFWHSIRLMAPVSHESLIATVRDVLLADDDCRTQ